MKNFKLLLFTALFYLGLYSTASANLPFEIKKGTKLTYQVTAFGSVYDFIAEITSTEDGVSFDWTMTNPVNTNGKIAIVQDALENARIYHNYFQGGTDLTLTDKSSVFLSKAVVDDLFKDGKEFTQMDLGSGLKSFIRDEEQPTDVLHVDINGHHTHLDMNIVFSKEDYSEVNFIQVGDYYLIVDMRTNFYITLQSIDF
jgi:hypothetical protein